MKKTIFAFSFMLVILAREWATAANKITFLPTASNPTGQHDDAAALRGIIYGTIDIRFYRDVRAQLVRESVGGGRHLLIYLHLKKTHKVEFAALKLNAAGELIDVIRPYRLGHDDIDNQVKMSLPTCPNQKLEFIAFAPNDDAFEIGITKDVAAEARRHGLNVTELIGKNATRQNYLNNMSCPKLRGNFYDGDGLPSLITTADGYLYAAELKVLRLNYRVTNLWVACQAYNNPMKTTLEQTMQSKKYGAGISNLIVGPSDRAARCTMIEALGGKPLSASFNDCYKEYDTKKDRWGFGGHGSDQF